MKSWLLARRIALGMLAAAALVIAGFAPVLYLAALLAWQLSNLLEAGTWVALPLTLAFTEHSLLQSGKASAVLPYIPQLIWPWLTSPDILVALHTPVALLLGKLHVALVSALVGLAVMALGALRAQRYMLAIRAEKERRADQLRRVDDYRLDEISPEPIDTRREPYLGTGGNRRLVA